MLDLGLGALAHANRHAAYAPMENHRWPELSIIQAAHAAELLIKARIAQEHPLLIFEKLPSSNQATNEHLALEDLFTQGRTFQWPDLPERLWATTGISIPQKNKFNEFGKLRNCIQHFAPRLGLDASGETLRFIFDVIDPFINECWSLFAIDYDEDDEKYIYFVRSLVSREILFLVSPEAAESFESWDADWTKATKKYKKEIYERVKKALANSTQK